MAKTTPGYVYFARMQGWDARGPVKIGQSRYEPWRRVRDLGAGMPYIVEYLAGYKSDRANFEEQDWHRLLGYRRMNGEWFDNKDGLLNRIGWALSNESIAALVAENVKAILWDFPIPNGDDEHYNPTRDWAAWRLVNWLGIRNHNNCRVSKRAARDLALLRCFGRRFVRISTSVPKPGWDDVWSRINEFLCAWRSPKDGRNRIERCYYVDASKAGGAEVPIQGEYGPICI